MIRQIEQFMKEWHMIPENRRILVGFSGGADSVCLMEVLTELSSVYGWELLAVHIHHGIRGTEADRDAEFVEKYCEKKGIPCEICRLSAVEEARKENIGLEEAGRRIRYRTFETLAETWKAGAIAVAHHENDQAETILFQIIRGSSLAGAGGIHPVQGKIIRPLLCVNRQMIRNFLLERGASWCEDGTNTDVLYTRNRIRHDIMPVLEQINDGCVRHLSSLALDLQETERFLQKQTEELWNGMVMEEKDRVLLKNEINREDPVLQKRVIYKAIEQLSGGKKDLTREHVQQCGKLFAAVCGKEITLPRGLKAWKEQEGVCIGRQKTLALQHAVYLQVPGEQVISDKIIKTCVKPANVVKITEKKYTKWVDYDKIETSLAVRKRETGDFICIDDCGHHKKLKDFLIDRKIPKYKRDSLWIIADGAHVVWIPGVRLGADYRVTRETSRVLEIKITGECEDE